MAITIIRSANPDLSWVLHKNPDSGMLSRKIAQGVSYSWFGKEEERDIGTLQTFNMFFQEGPDASSFMGEEFEYLSQNRWTSPMAHRAQINENLRSAWRGDDERDVVYYNEIELHQVFHKGRRMFDHLTAHLPVDIEYEEVDQFIFNIRISGTMRLQELLEVTMILCLMLSNKREIAMTKMGEEFVVKAMSIINRYNLPYYLRYLFSRNFLNDAARFDNVGHLLQTEHISIVHGDTQLQRVNALVPFFNGIRPVLDIGCGEGDYAMKIAPKCVSGYHAVDIDEVCTKATQRRSNARNLDVSVYSHLDEFQSKECVDILCTEVIEHMPLEDATALMHRMLKMNFETMVVTTPNQAFNKHYLLEKGEFRHDDHDWEMSVCEFTEWVNNIMLDYPEIDFEWLPVGDQVCQQPTSQGFVFKRKDIKPQAVICIGAPASGKSTFAAKLCEMDENAVELNRDVIRFKGFEKDWASYKFTRKNEDIVTRKWEKQLDNAITQGNRIVCSDTNLNPMYRTRLVKKLESSGYDVTFKWFDETLTELLTRDKERKSGVGYETVLNYYIHFVRQFHNLEIYLRQDGLEDVYIVDVDGTVSTPKGRSPYDDKHAANDLPIPHVVTVVDALIATGKKVFFFSARKERSREVTTKWLDENIPHFNSDTNPVFLRANDDERHDAKVKMELFEKVIRGNYNVGAVFDDRKQVLEECWEVLGVPVFNVGNPTQRF